MLQAGRANFYEIQLHAANLKLSWLKANGTRMADDAAIIRPSAFKLIFIILCVFAHRHVADECKIMN